MENKKEKLVAQRKYCNENSIPFFMPGNGICWSCRVNVTEQFSLETFSSSLITYCSSCNRSFCD